MPLLSQLALPVLTTQVLEALHSIDVRTVDELLFPSSKTKALLPLLFDSAKLEEIIESVRSVYTRPVTTAAELFDMMVTNRATIFSTGCKTLDNALGGGIYSGELTELVGQASTGKTQLCLSTALHVCLNSAHTVAYIDSSNSFSAKRIAEMYSAVVSQKFENIEEKKHHFRCTLSKLRVFHAFDIFSFYNILFQLKELLEQKTTEFGMNLKMIIIDSLGTLLAQNLVPKHLLGHAMMNETARYLKIFALDHQIAVLYTNYTVRSIGIGTKSDHRHNHNNNEDVRPALGDSWSYIPNTQLFLKHSSDLIASSSERNMTSETFNRRYAVVTKSTHNESNQIVPFVITSEGIVDIPEKAPRNES